MARVKITEHRAKTILFEKLGLLYDGISIRVSHSGKPMNQVQDKLRASRIQIPKQVWDDKVENDSGVANAPQNDGLVNELPTLNPHKLYVLKVDDGVKGRGKKGLVKLKVKNEKLKVYLEEFQKLGYKHFIVEEFLPHVFSQEKFLSLERTREGVRAYYSNTGGIDIEKSRSEIKVAILNGKSISEVAKFLDIPTDFLQKIKVFFEENYVSMLEINPLVVISPQRHPEFISGSQYKPASAGDSSFVSDPPLDRVLSSGRRRYSITQNDKGGNIHILDLAIKVDSTALFFTKGTWREEDIVTGDVKQKLPEEIAVKHLSNKSQAAFSLEVLNPNGSLFMLLSGGGASVTLADEAYNLGYGKEIANYGEYSGNPNEEETYLYTKEILSLLNKCKAKKKVLIIGGGVANFTDVRITFKGILRALEEEKEQLKKMKIKVFVRRGGPHEKEGLQMMEDFLKREGLFGAVSGPEMSLNEIVRMGIKEIK